MQKVADAPGIGLMQAAAGIIAIVNETMFGALRLISISQRHDPRDFALMPFGGAGPLHGNAMSILTGAWPVLVPPSPGVLCAYGDATARLRVDAQRGFNRLAHDTTDPEAGAVIDLLVALVSDELAAEGVAAGDIELRVEIDIRHPGQAFVVPLASQQGSSIAELTARFDAGHNRLFTFNLAVPHELVNIRLVALGKPANAALPQIARGDGNPGLAKLRDHELFMDGRVMPAAMYDRGRLKAGDTMKGPAIICEMDSTTPVHAGHVGELDDFGCILIRPD